MALLQQYYYWLSSLTRLLSQPLGNLADQVNIPLLSALLFGLIGAFAPCQLSTGAAAISFLARRANEPRQMWAQTWAYLAGKASVYLALGSVMILAGLTLSDVSATAIPLAVFARKALGPVLVVVGLFLAGWLKLRFSVGEKLSAQVERRLAGKSGILPAYGMGCAFALTFCPTLFWLFFGLTIPLAVATPAGWILPGAFALGTTLPLLALALLIGANLGNWRGILARVRLAGTWGQRVVGIIFVLIGLNEIILYWLI
jgi:cytochrome c-type biogenesis protein